MGNDMDNQQIKNMIENNINYCKTTLFNFCDSENKKIHKKAMLLAYWLKDYTNMIKAENSAKTIRYPKYKRGDILSVNFGFRIGNELGGRHFAIVLDNNNDINSSVITVLPLTSKKEGTRIGRFNYELEFDLLKLYEERFNKLLTINTDSVVKILNKTNELVDLEKNGQEIPEKEVINLLKDFKKTTQSIKNLNSFKAKMDKLKNGSIVNFSQITTISKQRILNPKQSKDALTGIRVKTTDLDKMNEKLKKLFIH